jgi:hypothetical protein
LLSNGGDLADGAMRAASADINEHTGRTHHPNHKRNHA